MPASRPAATAGTFLVPLLLVAVAAILLAIPGLNLPFLADDFLFLDATRAHPLPAGIAAPDPLGNFVRPVSRALYFGLITPLSGGAALTFHVVNTILFLAVLGLFFGLARDLVGPRGALVGTAFLALHTAFDVPLRWISGSQDLLALAFALAALLLHVRGRTLLAALALALALLSKEVVAGTAVIAWLLAWARGDDGARAALRRTAPLFAVTAAWAALWMAVRGNSAAGVGAGLALPTLAEAPAAFIHLVQVALGLEAGRFDPRLRLLDVVAVAVCVVAVAWAYRARARARAAERSGPDGRRILVAGLVWAGLGAIAVLPAIRIWSAYFFLFALLGLALALAACVERRSAAVAALAVAVLGLTSAHARRVDAFAVVEGAWTNLSHVNRLYIERAAEGVTAIIRDLTRLAPVVAPETTFLLGGIPGFIGFQNGDGAAVRWIYRDPTLRSYYVTRFRRDLLRGGPVRAFMWKGGGLTEMPSQQIFLALGLGMVELDALEGARDAFELSLERDPEERVQAHHWLAFLALARGDTVAARASLVAAGYDSPDPGTARPAALAEAERALAIGDSAAALRAALKAVDEAPFDPAPHALLLDLAHGTPELASFAVFEGFALRSTAPRDPATWRRWALLMAERGRPPQALAAIARYRALAPEAARADRDIDALERSLRDPRRSLVPGR